MKETARFAGLLLPEPEQSRLLEAVFARLLTERISG